MTARALVLAGRARYGDPWHDHAATSYRVACELTAAGFDVDVRGTFPDALADLPVSTLLVVNAGQGTADDDDATWLPLHERVRDHAAGGGPVLGLHQSAMAFADSPWWADVLGGRWVDGVSWHPEQAVTTFDVHPGHPVTDGLGALVVEDERYTDLAVTPGVEVLVSHEEAGSRHPVVWAVPGRPVVYDGLGHGAEAYASPSRCALLRREARWLVGLPVA